MLSIWKVLEIDKAFLTIGSEACAKRACHMDRFVRLVLVEIVRQVGGKWENECEKRKEYYLT